MPVTRIRYQSLFLALLIFVGSWGWVAGTHVCKMARTAPVALQSTQAAKAHACCGDEVQDNDTCCGKKQPAGRQGATTSTTSCCVTSTWFFTLPIVPVAENHELKVAAPATVALFALSSPCKSLMFSTTDHHLRHKPPADASESCSLSVRLHRLLI